MSKKLTGESMLRHSDSGVIHLSVDSTPQTDGPHSPVTPSSPSSKYSKSVLHFTYDGDCPFKGVGLSLWDNILGPRVRHTWRLEGQEPVKSDLFSHITRQVLSCEICRDPDKCDIDYKFYNLPHKGVIVPSFVFTAKATDNLSVHALFVIIPNSKLQFYLDIHDVLQCCFQRLASKIRVVLEKNPFEVAVDVFTKSLTECLGLLCMVSSTSLVENVKISDTAFCPLHVLERDFLARCIASHLMTFGRTLVIGETTERINLVLYTLSMFNSQSERRCSLPVCVRNPQPYHHDFFLQGLIKVPSKSFLPMTEIVASRYPTTIIDLTTREVKQTESYNDHVLHRYETLKNELICLQYGHFEKLVVLDQEQHHSTAFPETLVQTFIREVFELPDKCWVREAYITQFRRVLNKRAQCLIEYVKAESHSGSVTMKSQTINKMRHDLQLHSEGDFRIVLATAEKLQPGIFCFLIGSRRYPRDAGRGVETL